MCQSPKQDIEHLRLELSHDQMEALMDCFAIGFEGMDEDDELFPYAEEVDQILTDLTKKEAS